MLTHARLLELVHYDPKTGVFTRKVAAGRMRSGSKVGGAAAANGYRYGQILGKKHLLHRLAWFYMTGEWPEVEIDHRNRTKIDIRWANLREATRVQNNVNTNARRTNKLGIKGVGARPPKKDGTVRYAAYITVGRVQRNLGTFDTPEEASAAYVRAAQAAHGEFFHHGR